MTFNDFMFMNFLAKFGKIINLKQNHSFFELKFRTIELFNQNRKNVVNQKLIFHLKFINTFVGFKNYQTWLRLNQ